MASMGHVPEHVPDVWHGGRTLAVPAGGGSPRASQGCSWPRRWRSERRRGNPAASSWRERAPPLRWCRGRRHGADVGIDLPHPASRCRAPRRQRDRSAQLPPLGEPIPSPAAGGRPPANRIRARVPASPPVNCRRRCCARGVVRLPDPITLLGWLHLLDLIAEVGGVLPAACSLAFPAALPFAVAGTCSTVGRPRPMRSHLLGRKSACGRQALPSATVAGSSPCAREGSAC